MKFRIVNVCLIGILVLGYADALEGQGKGSIPLFNGVDLNGWTPKFSGHPVGENYRNTFTAHDGVLAVNYTEYDTFRNEFGHLFYKTPFTFYRLRLEYRFIGPATPGAPGWAFRNNGVMILAQSAESMLLNQDFPVSVEVQLLGGDGNFPRPTGNVCTPGTHVYMNGSLVTEHCTGSNSTTYDDDKWVKLEVVVLPDVVVHHIIEGDTVLTYTSPEIGGDFLPDGFPKKTGERLSRGYIAIQAESHSTEFRKIMIQPIRK